MYPVDVLIISLQRKVICLSGEIINTSACPVSDSTLQECQKVVDLVVRISGAQVGLIMRVHQDEIEVFVASKTSKNPYHVGEREHLTGSGLYCENVITKQEKLLVANATVAFTLPVNLGSKRTAI